MRGFGIAQSAPTDRRSRNWSQGGISLSRLGWGRTTETLAQHNRHLGVAAAGAVKAKFAACQCGADPREEIRGEARERP
jgi:hypothetical protein